jgi:predicted metalloprotease with PDZ domain
MSLACRAYVLFVMLLTLVAPRVGYAGERGNPPQIAIAVDAHTPEKHRIPVRLTLTGVAGPLTLVFPRWLPGMHAVQGPLGNFARLNVTADGVPLVWSRDPYDAYLIHLDVPGGTKVVEAAYDYMAARTSEEVFYGVAAGQNLAVLNPAAFSLAPQGDPRALTVTFSIRLPKGWSAATALPVATGATAPPDTVSFAPVSLYTLIDCPIMAGSHRKTIPLATPSGDVPHTLELFADTDEILSRKAAVVTLLLTRLVAESGRMFGVRHYRSFRFMLALTTEIGRNGLEHHEGVAYVLQPDDLDDTQKQLPQSYWNTMLIPHEFTHSWNGKFRRPYGQDVRSNTAPQSADLIWVYEGLTEYLGDVLMVRSGFRASAAWRHTLLNSLATMRYGTGREWESLADTALVAPYTYIQGTGTALRGVNDVYYEGELVWLEADAIIRRESKGTRSLDDFCRLFFGGPNRGPEVIPYTRQDIVAALQRTQPYDWESFIRSRFYGPPQGLPAASFVAAGWQLSYGDVPETPFTGAVDYRPTFGAYVTMNGRINGMLAGSLAERAGLEDGMTILGVNGALFTIPRLQEAVRATKGGKTPLELLVADENRYRTVHIEGLNGARFPTLVRDPSHPDLFAAITAPTVAQPTGKPGVTASHVP